MLKRLGKYNISVLVMACQGVMILFLIIPPVYGSERLNLSYSNSIAGLRGSARVGCYGGLCGQAEAVVEGGGIRTPATGPVLLRESGFFHIPADAQEDRIAPDYGNSDPVPEGDLKDMGNSDVEDVEIREGLVDQAVIEYFRRGGMVQAFTSRVSLATGVDSASREFYRDEECVIHPEACYVLIYQGVVQSSIEHGESAIDLAYNFRQGIIISSGPNASLDPTVNEGKALYINQKIEQYAGGEIFSSCLNCDAVMEPLP